MVAPVHVDPSQPALEPVVPRLFEGTVELPPEVEAPSTWKSLLTDFQRTVSALSGCSGDEHFPWTVLHPQSEHGVPQLPGGAAAAAEEAPKAGGKAAKGKPPSKKKGKEAEPDPSSESPLAARLFMHGGWRRIPLPAALPFVRQRPGAASPRRDPATETASSEDGAAPPKEEGEEEQGGEAAEAELVPLLPFSSQPGEMWVSLVCLAWLRATSHLPAEEVTNICLISAVTGWQARPAASSASLRADMLRATLPSGRPSAADQMLEARLQAQTDRAVWERQCSRLEDDRELAVADKAAQRGLRLDSLPQEMQEVIRREVEEELRSRQEEQASHPPPPPPLPALSLGSVDGRLATRCVTPRTVSCSGNGGLQTVPGALYVTHALRRTREEAPVEVLLAGPLEEMERTESPGDDGDATAGNQGAAHDGGNQDPMSDSDSVVEVTATVDWTVRDVWVPLEVLEEHFAPDGVWFDCKGGATHGVPTPNRAWWSNLFALRKEESPSAGANQGDDELSVPGKGWASLFRARRPEWALERAFGETAAFVWVPDVSGPSGDVFACLLEEDRQTVNRDEKNEQGEEDEGGEEEGDGKEEEAKSEDAEGEDGPGRSSFIRLQRSVLDSSSAGQSSVVSFVSPEEAEGEDDVSPLVRFVFPSEESVPDVRNTADIRVPLHRCHDGKWRRWVLFYGPPSVWTIQCGSAHPGRWWLGPKSAIETARGAVVWESTSDYVPPETAPPEEGEAQTEVGVRETGETEQIVLARIRIARSEEGCDDSSPIPWTWEIQSSKEGLPHLCCHVADASTQVPLLNPNFVRHRSHGCETLRAMDGRDTTGEAAAASPCMHLVLTVHSSPHLPVPPIPWAMRVRSLHAPALQVEDVTAGDSAGATNAFPPRAVFQGQYEPNEDGVLLDEELVFAPEDAPEKVSLHFALHGMDTACCTPQEGPPWNIRVARVTLQDAATRLEMASAISNPGGEVFLPVLPRCAAKRPLGEGEVEEETERRSGTLRLVVAWLAPAAVNAYCDGPVVFFWDRLVSREPSAWEKAEEEQQEPLGGKECPLTWSLTLTGTAGAPRLFRRPVLPSKNVPFPMTEPDDAEGAASGKEKGKGKGKGGKGKEKEKDKDKEEVEEQRNPTDPQFMVKREEAKMAITDQHVATVVSADVRIPAWMRDQDELEPEEA